jgi:hypothetical protein
MEPIVCYSLCIPQVDRRDVLLRQLLRSLRSLRNFNQKIGVHMFVYGDHLDLHHELRPYNVLIHEQGHYSDRLRDLFPDYSNELVENPLLHKYLNFQEISNLSPSQVLLLDCDTVFRADVEALFSKYVLEDCYAREEPMCKRSHLGWTSSYLNEELLADLAMKEGGQPVPPFNTGAILLNHDIWATEQLDTMFLSYVRRFMVWMALHPVRDEDRRYGEGLGVNVLRARLHKVNAAEGLTYPSANRWIIDEVALWLTLAQMQNLRCGDFDKEDVIQNGEYIHTSTLEPEWILCHYFGNNMIDFEQWAAENGRTSI